MAGRDLAEVFDDARAFTQSMEDQHGAGSAEHVTARWNEACMHAAVYDFPSARDIGEETVERAAKTVDCH